MKLSLRSTLHSLAVIVVPVFSTDTYETPTWQRTADYGTSGKDDENETIKLDGKPVPTPMPAAGKPVPTPMTAAPATAAPASAVSTPTTPTTTAPASAVSTPTTPTSTPTTPTTATPTTAAPNSATPTTAAPTLTTPTTDAPTTAAPNGATPTTAAPATAAPATAAPTTIAPDSGVLGNPSFPDCKVENLSWIGDGECDNGDYNTQQCGYDGGDCCPVPFVGKYCNITAPGCEVFYPSYIGDGECDYSPYNSTECLLDGGDCCPLGRFGPSCNITFTSTTTCQVSYPKYIGDGFCDYYEFAARTAQCGFDGGDCCQTPYVGRYCNLTFTDTTCKVYLPKNIGNGICGDYFKGFYNRSNCGYDGGDCLR